MTAPLPALSPSSILLPTLSHFALIPARKNSGRASKLLLFIPYFLFLLFFYLVKKLLRSVVAYLEFVYVTLHKFVYILLALLNKPYSCITFVRERLLSWLPGSRGCDRPSSAIVTPHFPRNHTTGV
jgi:hypothetical protein